MTERRWQIGGTAFLTCFMVWTHLTAQIRVEHWVMFLGYGALFWIPKTSQFAIRALPFLSVGLIYENLVWLLPYRPEVHVADLYHADVALFGVGTESLPKWFEAHTHPALDFVAGVTYMLYLITVFGMGVVFWFKDQKRMTLLAYGFFVVNMMGIVTWLCFPAAPPWYVEQYGLGPAVMDAIPSAAGTARFDALLGIQFFSKFYARSINVFGAMPSLHVGYPAVLACVCWSAGNKYRIPSICFVSVMAFAAVYLQHHYVLDVIAGFLYGMVAWGATVAAYEWSASQRTKEGQEEMNARRHELAQG